MFHSSTNLLKTHIFLNSLTSSRSQGFCQQHGAKAKRCRVEGCEKQAQGTHDGMCKRHWKAAHGADLIKNEKNGKNEDEDEEDINHATVAMYGESVYDHVIPQSISFRPILPPSIVGTHTPATIKEDELPDLASILPLISYLRINRGKPAGWHRNEERRARGLDHVVSLSCQLESWERQLVSCTTVFLLC